MGTSESRPPGELQTLGCSVVPAGEGGAVGDSKQEAALTEASKTLGSFSLPKGWRIVCRLPASDPWARWGARPRPANARDKPTSEGSTEPPGSTFEADVLAPELSKPLRVPLQLLPQWSEPRVGEEFLDRFDVRRAIPQVDGASAPVSFEVVDKARGGVRRHLRVLDLASTADIRSFAERLQLESLDADGTLFVKLHDLSVALPGRAVAVEDAVASTMWQELGAVPPGSELVARIGAVANAALTGLRSLHANGWAHCNVDPHSVVLTSDGRWKLAGLEHARRVQELAGCEPGSRLGTAQSPEALLGHAVNEKNDVWQLGATLAESILQVRLADVGAEGLGESARLCRLIDFAGPLPASFIDRHPRRELLFTPEGHVLRPVTPGVSGAQEVEAIEPERLAQGDGEDSRDRSPRPRLLSEKLGDAEGSTDIIEFLGRLLTPDPEHRPSAGEALAHHFLRFAHTKGGDKKAVDSAEADQPKTVKIIDEGAAGGGGAKPTRKGTGFVNVEELPGSSDEEEEKVVKIQDSGPEKESTLVRKGTGFVNVDELPASDDEEDEEESMPKSKGVTIAEGTDQAANGLQRKGTGFVNLEELPPSSDEEDEERKEVKIDAAESSNSLVRKGTGFVNVGELPPSSDEEDEEDAEKPKQVIIKQGMEGNSASGSNNVVRKGTGFVNIGELPPSSDEEDEERPKRVQIEDSGTGAGGEISVQRKGTGFVNVSELPASSDEEEDEPIVKSVRITDGGGGKAEGKKVRQGTNFVTTEDLPPDDDEMKTVRITDAGGGETEAKKLRQGTNFITTEELPYDEDERVVVIMDEGGGETEAKKLRQGTNFVTAKDIPDSDDEEGDGQKKAKIEDNRGDNESTLVRKGMGFVNLEELPPSSDEEDEEACKKAKIADSDSRGDSTNSIVRKGTGFVNVDDLPESSDEED